jgi:phosphoacetylglucosamine mutase
VEFACSFDGDADRIVFFASKGDAETDADSSSFILLDGDKISALICDFLREQFDQLYKVQLDLPQLSLGVVQTAYANGASTKYLQDLLGNEKVLLAKTGVKHVHKAAETFGCGCLF